MSAVGPFRTWFDRTLGEPTPAQAAAWPRIDAGEHTLILSPTGTGKTLAAFLAVLERLAGDHAAGDLPADGIQAVYVSPLRALTYDLEKNLRVPLAGVYGDASPLRVGVRTGDTPTAERDRQFRHPPHLLLTTPESLCLLLSQSRWLPALGRVRWVIVDELHALAENKRGAHLALSLERLAALHPPDAGPVRIGLSATVAPPAEAAGFLTGAGRPCAIVDVAAGRTVDLRVHTPLQRNPYPVAGFSGVRMMEELGRLIRANRTTLVFTNTRSGAESAAYWLRERLPDLATAIECHHGSLDRDVRLEVEDRLKRGELRAAVCSSSLELGIDIGTIDLVVMLATPKGVSRALQRTGRAGHRVGEVSRGLLMATNLGDLVECCATARLARAGHLDALRIPDAPLDVLAQQLAGMGCLQPWRHDDAFALVRRAWPYRDLSRKEFDDVLDYLAGGGRSLRRQYEEVFGRVHLGEADFETRAGPARRDFLQNIGTIPADGVVRVSLNRRPLGTVEEGFLQGLRVGDVFTLAGRPLRVERIGVLECEVSRADGSTPTVPRWGMGKFPLANRVAREIRAFRRELRVRLEAGEPPARLVPWIAERLECGEANARIIHRVHAVQQGVSEIPTDAFLLVEELRESDATFAGQPAAAGREPGRRRAPVRHGPSPDPGGQLAFAPLLLAGGRRPPRRTAPAPEAPPPDTATPCHFFFHSLVGRAANDALARVVAVRLSRLRGGNAVATADDYGFVLTVAPDQAPAPEEIAGLLDPDGFEADLDASLARSELLKYHFRTAAQTGLMVYRNYFGAAKTARKVQWSAEVIFNVLADHEPDHVLLREARRDARHTFLDAPRAIAFLTDLRTNARPIRHRRLDRVPPLSFGMYATRMREALLLEDPRETLERLYHQWWSHLEADPATASRAAEC